jgi:hypothetical protein
MRRKNHTNLKFCFAIGRIVTLRSPHVSKLYSKNASVLFNDNSRIVQLINLSITIRRRAISFFARNAYRNVDVESNFFLIRVQDSCSPPKLKAFSSDGNGVPIAIGESGLRGFDAEGLINSGYWVPGEAFVDWIWPLKSKRLHFLHTIPEAGESDRNICEKAWIVRRSSSKINDSTLSSVHTDVSIYPAGLLFNKLAIIDTDRAQNSETYRRGLFKHTDYDVKFRKLETEVVEVAQGSFIGSNVDFLFFESLAYGLPKFLQFLKNSPDSESLSQKLITNSNTHPATVSLFNSVLLKKNLEVILQPSQEVMIQVSNLDVYHNPVDWVGQLRGFRNEIREIASQVVISGENVNAPRRIFLVRALGARELPNRVPENIEALIRIAAEFEYQTIDPGSLSLPEQIELFKNVEFVISPHGGGLINLIWGDRNTSILEIFSGWNDPCFEDLAFGFGLNYEAFFCNMIQDVVKTEAGSSASVSKTVADENLFRLAIERQLARSPRS